MTSSTQLDYSALPWRKASASGANGCIQVAPLPSGGVGVRDSKNPAGPVLLFTSHEWEAFLIGVKEDQFDLAAMF